ncbi:NACHT domain-containing protein [Saccharopolyspora sp. NPDC003762]
MRLEDSTAIRDTYQAISSQRLVILGRAGAGKTVLAHHLILDLTDNTSVTAPVPVLFSLSDWNPTSTRLRAWLVQQLLRDFPFLEDRNPTTGGSGAEDLVDAELLLPVLDGFDEIPDQHHRAAIREINNVDWPLVLTSRPEQYAQAARTVKAVGRAAAIELDDLTLTQAHHYLRKSASKTRAHQWDEVFKHLETAPQEAASQNLTPVLRTPLMVTLARTTYNDALDRDPRELLDTSRFPTSEDLEEHLLDIYLKTLYDRRDHRTRRANHAPEDARHWLGYLATHLTRRSTHELTWWQLPATLHRHTRTLITTAACGILGGFGFTAVAFGAHPGEFAYLLMGFLVGFVRTLLIGLAIGLIKEVGFTRGYTRRAPECLRLSLRKRSYERRPPRAYLKKSWSEFNKGLALGLAVTLVVWFPTGVYLLSSGLTAEFTHDLVDVLVVGFVTGLVYGLVGVGVFALGDDHDPHATDPWTLLTRDRTVTLVRTTTSVLMFGILFGTASVIGIFGGSVELTAGLTIGLALGLVVGGARLMFSAWGNWLLFACLWLPLTGRLPWRPKRFLEDAYQRGVLRRAGAVYQFRHARLRDHLATRYRAEPVNR